MKDFTIVRKGFDTTEVDTYIVDLENELQKKDQLIEEYRKANKLPEPLPEVPKPGKMPRICVRTSSPRWTVCAAKL